MPPIIHDSEEEERYSDADSSAVALNDDEEDGEQYNNLNNYGNDQDSDLSSVLSDDGEKKGGDEDEGDEDEGDEDEGDEDEGDEIEADDEEQESSELEDVGDEDTKVVAEDDGEGNLEDDEGDEDADEEEEDEEVEEEEEEEEIPSISDEEDNYQLEDLDDIDDDLELREEEEEEIPKKVSPAKSNARTSNRTRQDTIPSTARETKKRQLTLYDEGDDNDDEEYDEVPKRSQNGRKSRRVLEPETQPQDLDADLILTDEEAEYNPRANPDLSKMTERQRSRYLEEENTDTKKEFLELDENMNNTKKTKPKKTHTDQEIAVRKAESARRRQDYKNKVLEEEKRDTLNKLLKRRANKTREVDDKEGSADPMKSVLRPRRPTLSHPALFSWVSNTTSLNGNSVLGYPASN